MKCRIIQKHKTYQSMSVLSVAVLWFLRCCDPDLACDVLHPLNPWWISDTPSLAARALVCQCSWQVGDEPANGRNMTHLSHL